MQTTDRRNAASALLALLPDILFATMAGILFVALTVDIALLVFIAWSVVVVERGLAKRTLQARVRLQRVAAHGVIMAAIVAAALLAPGKRIDRVKMQPVRLEKTEYTLAELRDYCQWYRRERFPIHTTIDVDDAKAGETVRFPAREITLGEFLVVLESQADLQHSFAGCGNASSIWNGPAYNFGLSISEAGKPFRRP